MYFSLHGLWGRDRIVHRQWKPLNEAVSVILAVLYDTPGEAVSTLRRCPRALGYLCGLHDPSAAGPPPSLALKLRSGVLHTSFRGIFGEQDGASLAAAATAYREEPEFVAGFALGADDFEDYLAHRVTPMGLVRVLPTSRDQPVMDAPRLLV